MSTIFAHTPGGTMIDPRQQIMWDLYVDPKSKTFGNAYGSAVAAGYSTILARQVYVRAWFKDKVAAFKRRGVILSDAEKALAKTLRYKTDEEIELNGKKHTMVNTKLLAVQIDAAKHVTKTLGKDQGWAERVEHGGPNGSALPTPIINVLQFNNRNKPDNGDASADTSDPRGNISEQDSIDSLISDSSGTE